MSSRLLLVRHAPAAHAALGGDAERPLTVEGRAVAAVLGRGLARLLPAAPELLSSPARRCRETAEAIAEATALLRGARPVVRVRAELALDASSSALRELARSAAAGTVLVSHQPELKGLAAALLAPTSVRFGLPAGSVLGLSPGDPEGVGPWTLDLAATAGDLEALAGD